MNVLGIEYSDSEDEQDSPVATKPSATPVPQSIAEPMKKPAPITGERVDNQSQSGGTEITAAPGELDAPAKLNDETRNQRLDQQNLSKHQHQAVAEGSAEYKEEGDGRPCGDGVGMIDTMRKLLREPIKMSTPHYGIPAEPEGDCDPAMQDKITKWLELKAKGTLFNERLTRTHAFRNPSIMSKLIEFLNVDEIGSNYSKDSFDPHGFPAELYYDQILKTQGMAREKLPATASTIPSNVAASLQQAQQRAIQFVSNINKMHNQTLPSAATTPTTGKRRSKWDQPAEGQSKRRM